MTSPSLSSIKGLAIDMDGVLWRGDTLLPGFHRLFEKLLGENVPFMLATNNSRKTQAQYTARLAEFGVKVPESVVLTSGIATTEYMTQHYPPGSKVFVVGEDGIKHSLREAGFTLSETEADVVVAGLDMTLTYDKLKTAVVLIRAGADYVGTNPDLTYPIEGSFAPGAGSILAAITAGCGQEPTVIGKPGRSMFEIALQKIGLPAENTAMLGDRLETDIEGAQAVGMHTVLLFSGVSQPADVEASNFKPTWCFGTLDDFLKAWENA
jgi:4-nitrophenyl phosphatase